jgi:hypothetical protein
MPQIEITTETFEKLKRLAEPLVDTTETVIARLADEAIAKGAASGSGFRSGGNYNGLDLDPLNPGSLSFTRVRRITLDGADMDRPKWNKLLRVIHLLARARLGSFAKLEDLSSARLREGRWEEDGFSYLPKGDFSIQGLDSNMAWDVSIRLARQLDIPVEVEFEWLTKERAAHPGERGRLKWEPPST